MALRSTITSSRGDGSITVSLGVFYLADRDPDPREDQVVDVLVTWSPEEFSLVEGSCSSHPRAGDVETEDGTVTWKSCRVVRSQSRPEPFALKLHGTSGRVDHILVDSASGDSLFADYTTVS